MRRALAVVLVLVLSGCAPNAPVLGDQQRAGIRSQLEGQAWTELHAHYVEALRPSVTFGSVVADHDWPAAVARCLHLAGYTVDTTATGVEYVSGNGQTLLEYTVNRSICETSSPRLGAVAVYLDRGQLGDLYDYYTGFVAPCLAGAGEPTTEPPERQQFVDRFFAHPWHPYDAVWEQQPNTSVLAALEQRCPPVPAWLHL